MPATAADLKFMASKTMLDTDTGGGPRSAVVLQNGFSNSIFADVAPADRTTGRTNVRKIYAGPLNADLAAVQSAAVMVDQAPTDPTVSAVIWAFGGSTTTRAQAVEALRNARPSSFVLSVVYEGEANCWVLTGDSAPAQPVAVQTAVKVGGVWSRTDFKAIPGVAIDVSFSGAPIWMVCTGFGAEVTVDSGATGYRYRVTTNNKPIGASGLGTAAPGATRRVQYLSAWYSVAAGRVFGAAQTTAEVADGDDVVLAPVAARVAAGTGATPDRGFPPFYNPVRGFPDNHLPVFRPDDTVTLWHEAATSPATASNGGTVNVGRTNLDELAVVGANGVEIARFLANGPSPGASCTADLAAGTVTFVNVTGFSQPVTVRHRIAQVFTAARVVNAGIGLATPASRAFPAGSFISSHLPLGDLAARVENVFSQQAWTRVWSGTVIGNPLPLLYNGTIGLTNQGAESDRWAIVMGTDGTSFTCYSELLGQVASGTTASNFSPINPATGAPFFTLFAASWALSLPVNGVLRFDTVGAMPPVWALRCTQPGTASGSASMARVLRGGVDA